MDDEREIDKRWQIFMEVYKELKAPAEDAARRIVKDQAKDVVQTMVIKLVERPEVFERWEALPKAARIGYFVNMVKNKCKDLRKGERVTIQFDEEDVHAPAEASFEEEITEWMSDATDVFLDQLLPSRRVAVEAYLEGLTAQEAADALRISYTNYTTRLHRGLEDLRRIFGVTFPKSEEARED